MKKYDNIFKYIKKKLYGLNKYIQHVFRAERLYILIKGYAFNFRLAKEGLISDRKKNN